MHSSNISKTQKPFFRKLWLKAFKVGKDLLCNSKQNDASTTSPAPSRTLSTQDIAPPHDWNCRSLYFPRHNAKILEVDLKGHELGA